MSSPIYGFTIAFAEEEMPEFLDPYRVVAFNTAHDSENKIHDDATARRFGFGGGLVPGVDVYGYITHPAVLRWGRSWLEHGSAECRFFKPVYDGDIATVTATDNDGALDITVESRSEVCATGRASLPDPTTAPAVALFERASQRSERPDADPVSLAAGTWLGLEPFAVTPEMAAQYLADSHETATIYREQQLVHPRHILRCCNFILSRNVVLGPWIHTGSRIEHFAAVPVGAKLSARARVTANYEHKGHRFVEIDCLVLADEFTVAARVAHIAIYQPRQVMAA
jgi:acyl dehydratase